MLALVNAQRKATNDRKRIDRELFDSLRRDKVDSIQKQQVQCFSIALSSCSALTKRLLAYTCAKINQKINQSLCLVSASASNVHCCWHTICTVLRQQGCW